MASHASFLALTHAQAPTEKERSQWYFQRYVQHLPSAGELVLFDRSWYNRAGVERVMVRRMRRQSTLRRQLISLSYDCAGLLYGRAVRDVHG